MKWKSRLLTNIVTLINNINAFRGRIPPGAFTHTKIEPDIINLKMAHYSV